MPQTSTDLNLSFSNNKYKKSLCIIDAEAFFIIRKCIIELLEQEPFQRCLRFQFQLERLAMSVQY
jgi:hypothetical protein